MMLSWQPSNLRLLGKRDAKMIIFFQPRRSIEEQLTNSLILKVFEILFSDFVNSLVQKILMVVPEDSLKELWYPPPRRPRHSSAYSSISPPRLFDCSVGFSSGVSLWTMGQGCLYINIFYMSKRDVIQILCCTMNIIECDRIIVWIRRMRGRYGEGSSSWMHKYIVMRQEL